MKVFITGIAGFIGSHLANHFIKNEWEVGGIDNLLTGKEKNLNPNIEWIRGDIRNETDFPHLNGKLDGVIHLAAQTSGEKSFELPLYDMQTNLMGTYHAYQFALKHQAKWLINMSSMSVYGNVLSEKSVSEDTRPSPVSLYGNTKLAAENMLKLLSQKDKLPVISLRLFNAYGPNQNLDELKQGMISIYLAYMLREKDIIVKGSAERVRDFIYIDDIVSAISAIINASNKQSGIYNLSTGKTTSVKQVLTYLTEATGCKKEIIFTESTPGDIQGFGGSCQSFCSTFNWQPQVAVCDGIKKMVSFYL